MEVGNLTPFGTSPATGEGCALDVNFDIGAHAACLDGRCGRLALLVVDPVSESVTDLVIRRGISHKNDHVVSIDKVVEITEGEIHLGMRTKDLEMCPVYREVAFRVPARGWNNAQDKPEYIRYAISPYEGIGGQSVTPSRSQHYHEGVEFGSTVIGGGTQVRCRQGEAGIVDHVLVDCHTGQITHLVVKRPMRPEFHIVPAEAIERVDDDSVLLTLTREEVSALPMYRPRA
jgi:hypothetical protein